MKQIALSFLILGLVFNSSAQRKVLIEQFTNSGCPTCAGNTPVVATYANMNPSTTIMLSYHTSFPYLDSMYFENSAQSNARVSYYSVSGVPTARVDGNYFTGNIVPSLNTTIPNRANIAPRYSVTFNNNFYINSDLTSTLTLQSLDAANENEDLSILVVVAERSVQKSSYLASPGANSETVYPWVVRKMLPDQNGTTLVNKTLNGSDQITVNWTMNNIKDLNEVRVIAFVQNRTTKEVYQAEINTPQNTTGVSEFEKNASAFLIYPTPANKEITISRKNSEQSSATSVRLMDLLGSQILVKMFNSTQQSLKLDVANLARGIYFVILESENSKETKRIILN